MIRLWSGVLMVLSASSAVRADGIEDNVVTFVEKLGGNVTRDEKQPGKPVVKVTLG
jgi:hypothetical protein